MEVFHLYKKIALMCHFLPNLPKLPPFSSPKIDFSHIVACIISYIWMYCICFHLMRLYYKKTYNITNNVYDYFKNWLSLRENNCHVVLLEAIKTFSFQYKSYSDFSFIFRDYRVSRNSDSRGNTAYEWTKFLGLLYQPYINGNISSNIQSKFLFKCRIFDISETTYNSTHM